MEIQTLERFFMWCTILDGVLLVLWSIAFLVAPDLVYRTQSKWVSIPRETFDLVMYSFLGLFKVLFLVFNAVPFLVLSILMR
ncbi:MAG: DUF6868 family protein [bacterium]